MAAVYNEPRTVSFRSTELVFNAITVPIARRGDPIDEKPADAGS